MASRFLRAALPLALLLAPALGQTIENDWSKYPKSAQSCLDQSANDAGCTKGTLAELNTCLCGNNNDFIINTAKCMGDEGSSDVDTTYDTMSEACGYSKTPIAVKKKDFQNAAKNAASATSATTKPTADVTTTTGGQTVTVTNDPNKDKDKDKDNGLSTGATIGIGVGAAVVGAAIVGVIAFMLLRRRKKKGEEANPMLVNQQMTPYNSAYPHQHPYGQTPTTFPPTDPSTGMLSPDGTYNPNAAWGAGNTPSPDPSKSSWTGSPQYTGPYAAPPQNNGGYVFEMDGTTQQQGVVEMPGSAPPYNPNTHPRP